MLIEKPQPSNKLTQLGFVVTNGPLLRRLWTVGAPADVLLWASREELRPADICCCPANKLGDSLQGVDLNAGVLY